MESASIGLFPEELMLIIARLTSLQAAASLWMSSKFWHNKLKHLLEHPKILIVNYYGVFRQVFMLNNGIGYDISVKARSSAAVRRNVAPRIAVRHGWFANLSTLDEFLSEFNQIMANNTKSLGCETSGMYVKVKPKNASPLHYSTSVLQGMTAMDEDTIKQLQEWIIKAKIVASVPSGRTTYTDGISLNIHGAGPWADLFMHPNGDLNLTMWTASYVPIEFHIRTSPDVFAQLEEVLVYSKHTKSLKSPEDIKKVLYYNEFDTQYLRNGKRYYVQEFTVEKGGQKVVLTNGYKTGSIKKIMKIFGSVLFNKSIKLPLYEGNVTPAPPVFAGHQLIRLPHYRMPVDEDFPSVVAITLIMKSTRRHLTLDLQSNVPFADLLALFREVEKNVDGRVTKNVVLLAIKIAKDCVIQEIEVYSFKSVKPITSLPKPLVLKVWDMLVRSGIVEL
jgi:hypothetical protein